MWSFNRGWPLNGGPLNRGSTVLQESITSAFVCHFKSSVCKVNHEVSASVWIMFITIWQASVTTTTTWASYTISRGSITLREFRDKSLVFFM